jgi:tRNA nucleotidyltransferase (CCA-adding enzyme)
MSKECKGGNIMKNPYSVAGELYSMLSAIPEYNEKMNLCVGCTQNNPHHKYDVAEHINMTVEAAVYSHNANVNVVLAAALHDIEKPSTKTTVDGVDKFLHHAEKSAETAKVILEKLEELVKDKYDKIPFDSEWIVWLIKHHEIMDVVSMKTMRKWCKVRDNLDDLWTLRICDISAQSDYQKGEKLNVVTRNCGLERNARAQNILAEITQPIKDHPELVKAGYDALKDFMRR